MTKNFIITPENPEGVLVDKTPEEITEQENRKAEHQQLLIDKANAETEAQAKETADATNKANGNQKLLDLGLSQAEATALTGYTPPSED